MIEPAAARTLRMISAAMGAGLAIVAALVLWAYVGAAGTVPSPVDVKSINVFTTVAMVFALAATIASELAWRGGVRKSAGTSGGVQTAFIVRLACREAAALLAMTVAFLAAGNGVLRTYPAYWVNLAPFVLFLIFLASHWPAAERLEAEVREIAP
jgi:hypothetical protein